MLCVIKKDRRTRSLVQNNYYWYLMTELQNENGDDKNDWHDFFGTLYRKKTKEFRGMLIEYIESTTTMSTIQMEDYLEKIRIYASRDLGCFLPKPNETEYDYFSIK